MQWQEIRLIIPSPFVLIWKDVLFWRQTGQSVCIDAVISAGKSGPAS